MARTSRTHYLRRTVAHRIEHRLRAPVRRFRNAGRTFRPIFATGAAGGGTSVLAVTLAQGWDCAGLVYECDSQIGAGSFLHVPPIGTFAGIADYMRGMAPRADWDVARGRDELQAMLRAYATEAGDAVVAKGPDIHLVRVGFLHACFPDALSVAVVRDPAANIEGLRRKWPLFRSEPLDACIAFYRDMHERYLDDSETFRERALVVRYRDLVAQPQRTLAAVAARAGIAPTTRRLRVPDAPNVEGQGIRNVKDSRVEMVTDADQRARERLAPGDARRIDAELASLSARLEAVALPI